jgi:hypothetical protein
MGFFQKLFGKPSGERQASEPEQHAVLLHLRLAGVWPAEGEAARFHELQDRLMEAIDRAGVGELDGDEFGEGECVVYMYGPNADRLWAAFAPVLKGEPLARGGFAVLRYGGVECGNERRVELSS